MKIIPHKPAEGKPANSYSFLDCFPDELKAELVHRSEPQRHGVYIFSAVGNYLLAAAGTVGGHPRSPGQPAGVPPWQEATFLRREAVRCFVKQKVRVPAR